MSNRAVHTGEHFSRKFPLPVQVNSASNSTHEALLARYSCISFARANTSRLRIFAGSCGSREIVQGDDYVSQFALIWWMASSWREYPKTSSFQEWQDYSVASAGNDNDAGDKLLDRASCGEQHQWQ
jgi:hypothetical protein